MSSEKEATFNNKYEENPIVVDAIEKFNKDNKNSSKKMSKHLMHQFIATIGLEIENRFPEVTFNNNTFKLFGRQKSEQSLKTKERLNTEGFIKHFEQAMDNEEENIPTQIRPIYDFHAFKFVCADIKDIDALLDQVVKDFLKDIKAFSPGLYNEIKTSASDFSDITNPNSLSRNIIQLIDSKFPDRYPGLERRFATIDEQRQQVADIGQFLESLSDIDLSQTTYQKYYDTLIKCYSILNDLSYRRCFEEQSALKEKANITHENLVKLESLGNADSKISVENLEEYSNELEKLLTEIKNKKTNKLNLSLGDLMIFDVLSTSEKIKDLGISFSKDPMRTKEKRMPNGYVSNFYSFDMPNNLTSELQVQSRYRYEYGENGPAAHNRMENDIKKRTLYNRPRSPKNYPEWQDKQFSAVPMYYTYTGNGYLSLHSRLTNFKRYYNCENPDTVQEWAEYIDTNNPRASSEKILHFSLNTVPVFFDNSTPNNKNEDLDEREH